MHFSNIRESGYKRQNHLVFKCLSHLMFIISLRFLTSCLFCSGNAIQTLKSNDAVRIITVRGTSFPAAETHDVAAPTEQGLDNSYIINIPRLIGNLSFTFYNIRRKYGIGEFFFQKYFMEVPEY